MQQTGSISMKVICHPVRECHVRTMECVSQMKIMCMLTGVLIAQKDTLERTARLILLVNLKTVMEENV